MKDPGRQRGIQGRTFLLLTLFVLACAFAAFEQKYSLQQNPCQQASVGSREANMREVKPDTGKPVLAGGANQLRSLINSAEVEQDPDQATEVLEKAVEAAGREQILELLDSLAGDTSQAAGEFRELLVRRWAQKDPEEAADWVLANPRATGHKRCAVQVATVWAEADFEAAANWAGSLPDNEAKTAALGSIAYEAARTNALAAIRLAGSLPAGADRDDLLEFAASQWAGADPESALTWTKQLPHCALRERLLAALAVAWSEQDGNAAATLVANGCGPGSAQARAAVAVVQRWAQTAPTSAASWVESFPESQIRQDAAETLIQLWAVQDPVAASKWLESLPEGALQNSAAAILLRTAPHQE